MVIIFVTNYKQFELNIEGLDEELADAVSKAFYEDYKTWKNDHPTASTRQQVNLPVRIDFKLHSDSSMGDELECSSRGQSNT